MKALILMIIYNIYITIWLPTDHELKLLGSKLVIKKKKTSLFIALFLFCFFVVVVVVVFFFITPTYFVILNFVFQIIPGTSAGRAMLLFICLAFFYFHNAETSQCALMENQHTCIDSTLASIDRSVLAVDVRSVWTIFVLFFLSLRKDI